MANMSYCRFENTVNALLDCTSLLEDEGWVGIDSYREKIAASDLYMMAHRFIDAYDAAVPTPLQQRAGLTLK
jgi:hypothetical protein